MDLLELAQQGDSGAFEQLIRPHIASIRRFAFAFSRNWSDADDLAQEALIKAFRSLPSFEGRSSLSTWLYALTRNLCHDHYRSRFAKARALEQPLDASSLDPSDDQEQELVQKGEAAELWRAIRSLEPSFRVPLVLCDIEELSYEKVAEIEGVPIGTVRSRLSRARDKLRQKLALSAEDGAALGEPPASRTERHAKEKPL